MASPTDPSVGLDRVIGLTVAFGPHELSTSRMSLAHSLIWSTSELHARASPVDGRDDVSPMASGPWVAALIARWYAQSSALDSLRRAGVELGRLLSTEVRYEGPVFGGELISCESTVRSATAPSAEGGARIVVEDMVVKTGDRPVLTSVRTYEWIATPKGSSR